VLLVYQLVLQVVKDFKELREVLVQTDYHKEL